jgi:hypothetical protein
MVGPHLAASESDDLSSPVEVIDRRLRLDLQAEHAAELDGAFVEKQVFAVKVDGHAKRPLRSSNSCHVIDMRVRQQDALYPQASPLGEVEERAHFVAGVDEHRFARLVTGDDESVLEEGTNRPGLD